MINIKKNFPIFINNPELIYLDNASTTQKPKQVIEAIKNYYENENANIHRGLYKLSEEATKKYEEAHNITASFINADKNEIIFTRNTTEAINLLAYSINSLIKKNKNEIVLTEMEHHSNLVPWQQLAKRKNMKLKFIKIKEDYSLDYEDAKNKITEKIAILSITHISNSLGTINNVKTIINLAKTKNALTIIDAAQSAPHLKINVRDLNCDFLVFSAHKMLGPTGIGVLYGKKELLEKMQPFNFGGDMISRVAFDNAEWNKLPMKFEAGTQNLSGAIGFAEAIKYIQKIGIANIEKHEKELLNYALKKLKDIKSIKIYSSGKTKSISIISFNLNNIHSHDVAALLAEKNICIRAGHHCNMPLMNKLKILGTARASFYLYNTSEDIDALVKELKNIEKMFKNA